MTLFTNPWLIGIGTGLIVSILTWIVSRMTLSKKENREYLQKVASANREVTYSLRPGIAEGFIPTKEIVEATVNSTARRYGIVASDLYGPIEIAEELVRDVIDSSFLSSSQKSEYCAKLLPLQTITVAGSFTADAHLVTEREKKDESELVARSRQRMVEMVSIMLSAMVGLITLFLATWTFKDKFETTLVQPDKIFPLLMPMLVTMVVLMTVTFLWKMGGLAKEKSETKNPPDGAQQAKEQSLDKSRPKERDRTSQAR